MTLQNQTNACQKLLDRRQRMPCLLMALLFCTLAQIAQAQSKAQPQLQTRTFKINNVTLQAEIADETHERMQGLSFRQQLALDTGMLFVYTQEQTLLFTMSNASIPLSIAFLDENMTIIEILLMTPFTNGPYASSKPARFALEMQQGWFTQNNIKPGDNLLPG